MLLGSIHLVPIYYSKQMDTDNSATTQVEEIKSNLRKSARKEVTTVPTLHSEALVELSTQPDRSDVAPTY